MKTNKLNILVDHMAKILQIIPNLVAAWDQGSSLNAAYNLSNELVKRDRKISLGTIEILNILIM